MRYIFLGAPGTGKGTQASVLSQMFGIPQISTGDILRKAVADGTELGRQAKAVMEAGGLVSDDIILALIKERLAQPDAAKGYILDGFPRTVQEAGAVDDLRKKDGGIDAVVYFQVDEEEIVRRLTSRRTCRQCGLNYNMISDPPPADNRCRVCGGEIYQRDDDKEETVRNRLRVYHEKTAPLVEYYRKQGKLYSIDGSKPVEEVRQEIIALQNRLQKH
ncbi:MAG: adenylate kinase [candidate division KSB1 bacterium]|nr:adenylate kinase [candidate division KSB1 bacterium]